jgi:hypothetical protein
MIKQKDRSKKTGLMKKISDGQNVLYLIILLALLLSVLNLGDRYFWGDEVHLLQFGSSITQHGLPVLTKEIQHEDITFEIDDITNKTISEIVFSIKPEEFTTRLLGKEIYTMHPWLLMYIEAIPISIWGLYNEFLIRLFFVLIGLLAIPLTYAIAKRITKKKEVANLSAFLLACSVVYLLAIRNANYYALLIASVPATIYFYLLMTSEDTDENRKLVTKNMKSNKSYWWKFALASAVLFHSNWLVFVATMLGIGIHFIIYNISIKTRKSFIKSIKDARYFIYSLVLLFFLTAPWFILTGQYSKGSIHTGLKDYILLLFTSTYQFIIWFVPLIFIILLAIFLLNKKDRRELVSKESILLIIVILSYILFISFNKYSGVPIRYYYGLLPIAMIINAWVIYILWTKTKIVAVLVMVLFIFTNLIQIAPILPASGVIQSVFKTNNVLGTDAGTEIQYLKDTTAPRLMLSDYIYEISHHFQAPSQSIVEYMRSKDISTGAPVFIGTADPNTIGYYTKADVHTYSENFVTRDYEFIVLDATDARNPEINMSRYDRAYFPLETYKWGDTPDPTHHVFQTVYGGGFYIYHKINT